MLVRLVLLVVAVVALARGEDDEKVIYGDDGRLDYYELASDDPFRTLMQQSIVALMQSSTVGSANSNGVYNFLSSYTSLGNSYNLCSGQKFRMDPTKAFCSGTLTAPDRVVTAGHCIDASSCSTTKFVFKYYVTGRDSDGVPSFPTITTDDVYSCRGVTSFNDGSLDYAVVHLDREVHSSHVPASVSTANAAITDASSVILVGCPTGLPFKVDKGGIVIEPYASSLEYFTASVDAFAGNSGSGVFSSDGTHVGILVRGAQDYVSSGSCTVVNVISGCTSGCGESISYAFHAHGITDCHTDADCSDSTCDRTCATDSTACTGLCGSSSSGGGGGGGGGTDNNIDPEAITTEGSMTCGSVVTGTTQSSDFAFNNRPTHFYSVTIGAGDATAQTFATCNSLFDTMVYVWSDDGTLVANCDDCGQCIRVYREQLATTLEPGSYYVGVMGFGGGVGDYELQLTCGETESGPVSSISCGETKTGTTVGSSSQYLGQLVQEYSLSLNATTSATLSTCGSGYDTVLYVFESQEVSATNLVTMCDDCGSCGRNEELAVNLDAGEYTVVVGGYFGTTGEYSLKMSCTSPSPALSVALALVASLVALVVRL